MTNILIIAPAWVGDMVMAQVLFLLLKQQTPDCQIDVIAPASSRPLLQRMPQVREAIALDITHGEFGWRKRRQLGHQLRQKGYQQAIILTNSWKSALLPWFAKIAKRTSWLGEQRYVLLNDYRRLDKTKYPLMIERFALLGLPKGAKLPKLPRPKLEVNASDVEQTLQNLSLVTPQKPLLAICPGAEYGEAKRWPANYYGEVAKQKIAKGWDVWLFGSAKDAPAGDVIQSIANGACVNIIGKTNLLQAVDLLSLATAVVSNDSGLMHIAAALSRRLVVIYGSSSAKFTPPLTNNVTMLSLNLDCSPCFERECPLGHLNCLRQLMPERVLAALADKG